MRLRVHASRNGEADELELRPPVPTRLRVPAGAHVAPLHGAHAAVKVELGGQRLGQSNVVRRANVSGVSFGGEGVQNLVLSPRGERRAQVIETHVAPGGSPGPEPWSHSGELIIATILEGRLEFRFEHHTTVLEAGDTIAYSPADPHSWGNPSETAPAVALFFGMPAEF